VRKILAGKLIFYEIGIIALSKRIYFKVSVKPPVDDLLPSEPFI
jgi:hypothetical protein